MDGNLQENGQADAPGCCRIDVVIFVVDACSISAQDHDIAKYLQASLKPTVLAANKS
jgi:predicted GTPase